MPRTVQLRTLVPALIVAVAFTVLVVLVTLVSRDPVVESVVPTVVSTGDEVTVTGRHFGTAPGTLILGGRQLPSSAIVDWDDRLVRFVIPRTINSGLLYVITERGRSEGVLVQMYETIPRTGYTGEGPGTPVISGIDTSELVVGGLVTLSGVNFGRIRRSSRVVFPMQGRITCETCAEDSAYAHWSDTRITVRVPAGVTSGFLSVVTPWGASNPFRIVVNRPAGSVVAEQPLEIALRYGVQVDEIRLMAGTSAVNPGWRDVVVRLPSVAHSPAQRAVRYLNGRPGELRFEQIDPTFAHEEIRTVLVHRYTLRSEVDPARIVTTYERETGFYDYQTRQLPGFPVHDPQIRAIADRLRANRANPYRVAESVYAYTLDNLEFALGLADRSVSGGLESGLGDSATYAALFVTLLRAAGVPARPVGGIILTADLQAYPHFWAEFFVTGVGWIPADPALGDGAFPAQFPVPANPRDHYFGNLDNRRVAFLYGYDASEAELMDGVSIVPDRPYTFQRAYAEAGRYVEALRLGWPVPRVIGVFMPD